MEIIEVKHRTPDLLQELLNIWEDSVKATHHFLSNREIQKIKRTLPQAFLRIPHLVVVQKETELTAFMGIDGHRLEMLFLSPKYRGQGVGKRLIWYAIENYDIHELTVNEQNPQARGFYEHMGFRVFRRSALDEQGNPYPLLYMQRSQP